MYSNIIKKSLMALTCSLLVSACSEDNTSFETPSTTVTTNAGVISHNNFTILVSDLEPAIFAAPGSGTFTFTELEVTVRVGDRNNTPVTDEHTVFFKTEWGLIQPSCITEDGTCTVTWQTSSGGTAPADHLNTIMAYTIGEESFVDANGNSVFDDGDTTFTDLEEPFVDSNKNSVYDSGEPIVDAVNGNDPTGVNGVHDIGDTFFNGRGCTHSSLCSTTNPTILIWDDLQINMDGPTT